MGKTKPPINVNSGEYVVPASTIAAIADSVEKIRNGPQPNQDRGVDFIRKTDIEDWAKSKGLIKKPEPVYTKY